MRNLVMISGKPRVGKSYTAKYLQRRLLQLGYEARIEAFAAPIKVIGALYLGLPAFLDEHKTELYNEVSGRDILHKVGDGLRSTIPDYFTSILFRNIKGYGGITIVDDLRFHQELKDAVKSSYVPYTLRVNKEGIWSDHPNESELDHYGGFTEVAWNSGDSEYLKSLDEITQQIIEYTRS